MKVYGGRAGFNSVIFTGQTYHSIAKMKNGTIITKTWPKKRLKKLSRVLNKIPFIRSLSFILELILDYWKAFFLLAVFLFLSMYFMEIGELALLFKIYELHPFIYLLLALCIVGIIIKATPLGKYHAAEHMVLNAYDTRHDLSLETIKKQPRTHKNCGTNFVITFCLCYGALSIFFSEVNELLTLLSFCVAYELWRRKPKHLWRVIFKISKRAQYYLFTSKPEDRHIQVAMAAFSELKDAEVSRN